MGKWEAKLIKSGNSIVVALPPAALNEYGWKLGEKVTLTDRPEGSITLTRESKRKV